MRVFAVPISTCLTHLVVYPLVDFLLVVKQNERLGRDGVPAEDEAQVTALTLHICEIYQGGVQSRATGRDTQTQTHRHADTVYCEL